MIQHLLIFNLSVIISVLILIKIEKKQTELRYENIFFYTFNQVIKSFIIVWSVIFCFLILYRIVRFVLRKNLYLDLSWLISIITIDNIIVCTFVMYLIFKLRLLVKYVVKKHFLKLHYYCFMRCNLYLVITQKLQDLGFNVAKKHIFYYKVIFFIINDLLNYIVIFFLLKNIIFDKGIIFIGLLPYYGMYYFVLNYIKFVQQMRPDYEKISLQFYYSFAFDLRLTQIQKLYKYHNQLVFNEQKYYFDYSWRFNPGETYPYGWIFITEQEVTEEIFDILNKNKPEFFPPRIKNY